MSDGCDGREGGALGPPMGAGVVVVGGGGAEWGGATPTDPTLGRPPSGVWAVLGNLEKRWTKKITAGHRDGGGGLGKKDLVVWEGGRWSER